MARPQRIEYEGAVYHVTARGNERRAIFRDDADRERFLRILSESVERYEVRLYLFCLMTNHLHLVVETPRANLGQFMHRLQTAYTVYFNRRHTRCGHLMQGRYQARLVEKDAYILRLSRYVHLNPVFTAAARRRPLRERITMLRRYHWSSYCSYIGGVRAIAARMLCHHGGLTQRQVARILGIHNGASISRQLHKLACELESNRGLRNQVCKIANELKCRWNEH